jgi:hypothetical protein
LRGGAWNIMFWVHHGKSSMTLSHLMSQVSTQLYAAVALAPWLA